MSGKPRKNHSVSSERFFPARFFILQFFTSSRAHFPQDKKGNLKAFAGCSLKQTVLQVDGCEWLFAGASRAKGNNRDNSFALSFLLAAPFFRAFICFSFSACREDIKWRDAPRRSEEKWVQQRCVPERSRPRPQISNHCLSLMSGGGREWKGSAHTARLQIKHRVPLSWWTFRWKQIKFHVGVDDESL